jgi:hypothetical protein
VRRIYNNGRLNNKGTATDYYFDTILDPALVLRLGKDIISQMHIIALLRASESAPRNIIFH